MGCGGREQQGRLGEERKKEAGREVLLSMMYPASAREKDGWEGGEGGEGGGGGVNKESSERIQE